MKKKIIVFCLVLVLAFALIGCGDRYTPMLDNAKVIKVECDLTESIERIQNPDIGFYRTLPVKLTEAGGTSVGTSKDYQLHHLRVNIGDFSKANNTIADKELTHAALDKLGSVLADLKTKGKSAIIRFAYDGFNGVADTEPSEEMILKHISQLSPLLESYRETVPAIEAGLVGKWGEMHSSRLANPDVIDKIVDGFLTGTTIPVLVRTPAMIYHYLGITRAELDSYTVEAGSKAYRLGLFNDGYLGSDSDLGTYTDRAAETAWLAKQTAHLPYGGEVMNTDMASIDNCLAEMDSLNLSYLNYEWNNKTTQEKWVAEKYKKKHGKHSAYYDQTAQLYIENHLGYRLVVRDVKAATAPGKLEVKIKMENVGFGNLTGFNAAMFINDGAPVKIDDFTGDGEYTVILPADGVSSATVYLCVQKGTDFSSPSYPVAFANVGMYDSAKKANVIGKVELNV